MEFVHRGRKSVVPVPDTAGVATSAEGVAAAALPPAATTVPASAKADAGSPPRVCASAAFNA